MVAIAAVDLSNLLDLIRGLVVGVILANLLVVICLVYLVQIKRRLRNQAVGQSGGTETAVPAVPVAAPSRPLAPAAAEQIPNRGEVIAAVSAVLAEELGTDVSAIRILSFRRVGGAVPAADLIPNRGEVVAAVSAALAEELGTDVSAIRILSFQRVGGVAPAAGSDRGEMVAAVSAAVAEELGTDVSAIRIRSFQKVS